ncbi:MAG: GLPGLI family protein [Flavobacteriaceae bacterium]|nr:GLPGLI family protein [Flavobacteriaceae bacterium]MCY4217185.1 GLPGLI family protein [Flavobacteriaceae bacterium]MCY4254359.1 GLPGLI family protein [Flavobacteriaceae bacterium]
MGKEFILKENTETIKWNLQAESKIINSFNCQKAIGKFGGRDYIVWYTNEIPVPIGPWKIDGLPGTVVSGISQDDRVSFSLSKVTHDISWPEIEKLDPKPDDIINCDDDFRLFNQENEAQIKKLKSKMPRNITIAGITVDYDRIQKECDQ